MKKICISKGWLLNAPGTNGWREVDLPNDYAVTQPRNPHVPGGASNGFFGGGTGTYVKNIELGKGHYILDIDGAYMCASVKLNEYQLVMHPHGYTPFLVDLTERKKDGLNKLSITTHAHQPSTRWYSGAGVYRDVFLWHGGEIRIEPWDIFVSTPTLDTVEVSYEISSDKNADVTLAAEILAGSKPVNAKTTSVILTAGNKTAVKLVFDIKDARAWSIDDPYLYTLSTKIINKGEIVETDKTKFGIRTISADAENGLLFNGKPLKLRGGCIHHDHGVLGAADYPAACRRKLTKLKEAGFNALRIAHNPPSITLLEMCDEMGIIVMDEAFDCWRLEKGGELNYHMWFDGWWDKDIASMVRRDRKHPCVIAYSIGNEIPESYGNCDGDEWSARLTAEIKKYDNTRFVTSATYQMGDGETWADRTKGYYAPLDICGYNYLYTRYERDHKQFPNRVIWGSETHAIHFYDSWQTVLNNSYVIGDFTWTAYDNLGEAGTGRSCWARDGVIRGISLAGYPWRSCYQGDLDLCGFRRPQSYFREAVWLNNTEPHIFTTHPEHYGEGFSGTEWHWYDVLDSWTFDDKYIGKPVKCDVYTAADEIEWYLNDKLVGRSQTVKAVATLDIPYEKGVLSVIAYKNGKECGRSSLHSVGSPHSIKIIPETNEIKADGRDLCYFDIYVTDSNGDRIPDSKSELCCIVDGGELLGIFSGDPKNEDNYGTNICHAFEGRAVAVVKTKTSGELTITVGADKLNSGKATIKANK